LKCVQKCACPTVPNTPQWTRISCPAELPGQPKTDYPCLDYNQKTEVSRTACSCNDNTFTITYKHTCGPNTFETLPCPAQEKRMISIEKGQSHYKRTLIVKYCSQFLNSTIISQVNNNMFVGYLPTPVMCSLPCLCEQQEKWHDWSIKVWGTFAANGDQCTTSKDAREWSREENVQASCFGDDTCGVCSGTCTMPSVMVFNDMTCPKPAGYVQGAAPSKACNRVDYCGKMPDEKWTVPCAPEPCCVTCGEICGPCPVPRCPSDGQPTQECYRPTTCNDNVPKYEKPCGAPAPCPPPGPWGPYGQCSWIEQLVEPGVDSFNQGTCVCGGYRERTRTHECMEDVQNGNCGINGVDFLTEIDSTSRQHHSEFCYNQRDTCVINEKEESETTNLCGLADNMCSQRICTWRTAYNVCDQVRRPISQKVCHETEPVPCCAQWQSNKQCQRVGAEFYKQGLGYNSYASIAFQQAISGDRCSYCAVAEIETASCVAAVPFCADRVNLGTFSKDPVITEAPAVPSMTCDHQIDRACNDKKRNPHFKNLDQCCQAKHSPDSVFLFEGVCTQYNETAFYDMINNNPLEECFVDESFNTIHTNYDKCRPQGLCFVYCNADCVSQAKFLRRCSLPDWEPKDPCIPDQWKDWTPVSEIIVNQQTDVYGAPPFAPINGPNVNTVPDTMGLCEKFFGNSDCGGYIQQRNDCCDVVRQIKCPAKPCLFQPPQQPRTCYNNQGECDLFENGSCIIERMETLISGCPAQCPPKPYRGIIPPCLECVPQFEESCPVINGCVCPGEDGAVYTQTKISWVMIDVSTGRRSGGACGNMSRIDDFVYPEQLKEYMRQEARGEITFATPYVGPEKAKVACTTRPQAMWIGSRDCPIQGKCDKLTYGNIDGGLCARIVKPNARQELQCNGVTMPTYKCGVVVKDIPCDGEEIYAPRVVEESNQWNNGDQCNGCCATKTRKCVDRFGNLAPFSPNPASDPMCEKCGCGCCQASMDKSNIIREGYGIEEIMVSRKPVIVVTNTTLVMADRTCPNGKVLPVHCFAPGVTGCKEDICGTRCFQQGHVCGRQQINSLPQCYTSKPASKLPVPGSQQSDFRFINPVPLGFPANWECDREMMANIIEDQCSCDQSSIVKKPIVPSYEKKIIGEPFPFNPSGPEFYGIKQECISATKRTITTIRYCPLSNGQTLEHVISVEDEILTKHVQKKIVQTEWSTCSTQCFECGSSGIQSRYSYDDCKIDRSPVGQTEERPCGCPISRWGQWQLVQKCDPCGAQEEVYQRICAQPNCQAYVYGFDSTQCSGQCNQCVGDNRKVVPKMCKEAPRDCQIIKQCDSSFPIETGPDGRKTQLRTCSDQCGRSIKSRIICCNCEKDGSIRTITPVASSPSTWNTNTWSTGGSAWNNGAIVTTETEQQSSSWSLTTFN